MLPEYDETADREPICDGCGFSLEEYTFAGLCPDCVLIGMNLNAPEGWEFIHLGGYKFEIARK